MEEYQQKYDSKLVNMSDVIENALYLFNEGFELDGAALSCGPCGGKCYGCRVDGPGLRTNEDAGLVRKVNELLDE
jgi:hypothetical protein